jgi:hypothetical protein
LRYVAVLGRANLVDSLVGSHPEAADFMLRTVAVTGAWSQRAIQPLTHAKGDRVDAIVIHAEFGQSTDHVSRAFHVHGAHLGTAAVEAEETCTLLLVRQVRIQDASIARVKASEAPASSLQLSWGHCREAYVIFRAVHEAGAGWCRGRETIVANSGDRLASKYFVRVARILAASAVVVGSALVGAHGVGIFVIESVTPQIVFASGLGLTDAGCSALSGTVSAVISGADLETEVHCVRKRDAAESPVIPCKVEAFIV